MIKKQVTKKSLAVFLCFSMLFNLFIQFFAISNIYAQNYEYQNCYTDASSGTAKFVLKYDDGGNNPSYAYVVGDFNNWKYEDKYKMTWKQDIDGVWKMITRVSMPAGNHSYKYKVHYGDSEPSENDEWKPDGDNLTFNMPKASNTEGIKMYSSRNKVASGKNISFFTSTINKDGFVEGAKVTYAVEPNVNGVNIDDKGILSVADTVADGTSINVKATTEDNKTTSKTITVSSDIQTERTVHYYRYDKDSYGGWNVWAWEPDKAASYQFTEHTDFGKVCDIKDNTLFIVRKSVDDNEWKEQTLTLNMPKEAKDIYVFEGKAYTNFAEAMEKTFPHVEKSIMDSKNKITSYLSHIPKEGTTFELYMDGKKIEGVNQNICDKKVELTIPDNVNFEPNKLIEVRANKMFESGEVTKRNVLNEYYYSGNDLGVTYTKDKINLKLWAPTASNVNVMTYDDYKTTDDKGTAISMTRDESVGVWSVSLDKNNFYGKYFKYQITFNMGTTYSKTTYAVDPYATAVGVNGDKGAFVSMDDKDVKPSVWKPSEKPELKNPEDSIIYEMHIRDFTIDENSGVDKDKKGKFLGAAETGTVYHDETGKADQTIKTGIDHLKELGITHVQLLPIYDFGSVDETSNDPSNRNWGYDPKNHSALEGSYSTNPYDPKVRIKEFRQMVQAMHDAGIRVVMDVVYNHMQGTTNLDNIVPEYYFRTNDKGVFTNGSGCGNEMASERPMIRKYMVDSVKHWAKNYNIDGFRFDLMELIDVDTIKEINNTVKSIDPSEILYGEPWAAENPAYDSSKYTNKGSQKGNHFGAFNDTYRDTIRGNNDPGKGYINGGESSESAGKIIRGIKGSIEDFTSDPEETINYTEAHDNYVLWDQITKSLGKSPELHKEYLSTQDSLDDEMIKRDLLGQSLIYTSQGIAFTHAGTEFLRSKKGDHNSYKSSDDINEIDWKDKKDFKKVFDYNKGLIKLRKDHPAFRMTTGTDVTNTDNLGIWTANYDNRVILYQLKNHANGDDWNNILVIYNPTDKDYDFSQDGTTGFPNPVGGKWHCVVNGEKAGTEVIEDAFSGKPTVAAHSMMVLYDEEKQVKELDWSYLFSDQSKNYMEPMEPTSSEDVKVRLRAKAGNVEKAILHYYDEGSASKKDQTLSMTKIIDDNFYQSKGYDKSKVEFWEATIPKGMSEKYYNFEVKYGEDTAWISGGTNFAGDNKGVTNYCPKLGEGINYGFRIVPDYKTPDWSKEAVLYQVMVDRFRNGDTKNDRTMLDPAVGNAPYDFSNPSEILKWNDTPKAGYETDKIWNNDFYNGDLVGVKQALPYLKNQLGVTGLYLMPIFQSESNHKYDTESYDYVDKNFGGNKSLQELMNNAHSDNMNVILDGVFNHTSTSNEWFKDAMEKEDSKYRDYYFFGDGKDYVSEGYYAWNKMPSLPKLNYSSKELQKYMYSGENSIVKKYLKAPYKIDGWRLDAADDISMGPDEYKTGAPNHNSENLQIWEDVNKAIKTTNPNAYILGEFWGTDTQWLDGKHWDGKMNYSGFQLPFVQNRNANPWLGNQSLDNKGTSSVSEIAKFARNQFNTMPYQAVMNSTNSISTHDRPRFLDWDYTGKGNESMMQLAAALQMTYVGVPMIYYGDEIGMASQKSRTDKKSLDDGNDPYNREAFNWDISSWNIDMLNDYRTLIETRKSHKNAFVYGAFEEVTSHNDNKYLVYARYGDNDKSLVVLNNSGANSSKLITIKDTYRYGFKDGDVLKDVISGDTIKVADGTLTINSKDMTASVYVIDNTAPQIKSIISPELDNSIKDSRIQLSEIKGVRANLDNEASNNIVKISWDKYTDANAKDILVRLYDSSNKVIKEEKLSIDSTSITFENINNENYRIAMKAEANRDLADSTGIDDQYMDSIYTIAGVSNANIANGQKEVAINTPITISYDRNIEKAEKFEDITVEENNGIKVDVDKAIEGNKLTLIPKENLKMNTKYTVSIPENSVEDPVFPNQAIARYNFEFTTKEAAPEVESIIPENGTKKVSREANVIVNFTKEIKLAKAENIILKDSEGKVVSSEVKAEGKTLTIDPKEDLDYNKEYTLTVKLDAVVDGKGNNLAKDYEATFTTEQEVTVLPEVEKTTPENGAKEVSRESKVIVNFTKDVTLANAENVVLKDSEGNKVAAEVKVEGKTLTVDPKEDLDYNKTYILTVKSDSVVDEKGNNLAKDYEVRFTTEQDKVAPEISESNIANEQVGIELNPTIEITFTKSIVAGEKFKEIKLVDEKGNKVNVETKIEGKKLVVKPETLEDTTKYTLIIPKSSVKDLLGNEIKENKNISFKTVGVAPQVENITPVNESREIKIKSNIVVNFTKNIKLSKEASINLKDSEGKEVAVNMNIEGKTLTIDPKENLDYNKEYTLTVKSDAIVDVKGNKLVKDYKTIFTTEKEEIPLEIKVVNDKESKQIIQAIESVKEGTKIIVDANKNNVVDDKVFSSVKGKDITITIEKGNVKWSFNGKDVKIGDIKDVDISLNNIPENLNAINKKLKNSNIDTLKKEGKLISFKNNGILPAMASVKIKLDKDWIKEQKVNTIYFYYYNPSKDDFEFIEGPLSIDKEGCVTIHLTHCSDYMFTTKKLEMKIINKDDEKTSKTSNTVKDNTTNKNQNNGQKSTTNNNSSKRKIEEKSAVNKNETISQPKQGTSVKNKANEVKDTGVYISYDNEESTKNVETPNDDKNQNSSEESKENIKEDKTKSKAEEKSKDIKKEVSNKGVPLYAKLIIIIVLLAGIAFIVLRKIKK